MHVNPTILTIQRFTFVLTLLTIACQPAIPTSVKLELKEIPKTIDYNRHVQPILSDRCFTCHGNDQNKLKAGLRLDIEQIAKAPLHEHPDKVAIAEGKTHRSELVQRILVDDPEKIMPPPESQLTLSNREKAILIAWIDQGAEYKPHWAFVPPKPSAFPESQNDTWSSNNIDKYVLKKLQEKRWSPAASADKETLLRRVTLDIIGLPPTIQEIGAFLKDDDPQAYERVVDRLLSSPHYGERMAADWMDISRFADTHGYTVDRFRDMSPWRDWVIQAFNQNMPYDTFVIWQLAGDLLPNPTKDQILATGFNRNHQQNMEGGIVDEEFRVEYVSDRTNTFGTAFLGMTLECAKCHDHKYDPISQKEYFQLFSYFNNVKEAGQISFDNATPAPSLLLTDDKLDSTISFIANQIELKENELENLKVAIPANLNSKINLKKGLVAHFPLDDHLRNLTNGKSGTMNQQHATQVAANFTEGYHRQGLLLDGDAWLDLSPAGQFGRVQPFAISLWINLPTNLKDGVIFHQGIGAALYNYRGFHLALKDNALEVLMAHNAPYNAIIRTGSDVPRNKWIHLTLRYDGSGKADGLNVFLNGEKFQLHTDQDKLYKTIQFGRQNPGIQIGARWRGAGIKGAIVDDIRVYNRMLSSYEIRQINSVENSFETGQLSEPALALFHEHLQLNHPTSIKINKELFDLRNRLKNIQDTLSEIMIMADMKKPRITHVLERGQYDAYGDTVHPATPESILGIKDELPGNRLGLAKWLFHDNHPLTARVIANRIWQQFFENGLVQTSNDFGFQGSLPSHPELLDYLAISLRKNHWDLKYLIKEIVMSSTYRQSSLPSEEIDDAQNIWLSRGPSSRLTAEMLRDNVLAACGILNKDIGGPSVMPYQPDGLWSVNGGNYVLAQGPNLYKRSLYTFWKRTVPHPTLGTFDAPDKSICTVTRQKTSTPLQALVLLNDPTFLEAAKIMGEQITKSESREKEMAITFRKLTGRLPSNDEMNVLQELFESQQKLFNDFNEKAKGWIHAGMYETDKSLDVVTLAANTVVASAIINSEAVISKR